MGQDKESEERASGKTLNRFRTGTWERQDSFKRDNLIKAGLYGERGKTVLDFGCGPGTYGILLGHQNRVVGVDLAREAIFSARKRATRERSSFEGVVMDGDLQGFAPNSFDVCLSAWALHHFPDLCIPLKQLCYTLKPGGRIVIIEPNESSIPQRISRLFEGMARQVVLSSGLDTPNRTTHIAQAYLKCLEGNGLRVFAIFSHYNGERAVLPSDITGLRRVLLRIAIDARHLLFMVSGFFGVGAELFIIAQKKDSSDGAQ